MWTRNWTDAHSAEADTMATYEVLQAQLDRYPNLENDIGKLAEFSAHNRNVDFAGRIVYNEDDVEVFNFGKYKGKAGHGGTGEGSRILWLDDEWRFSPLYQEGTYQHQTEFHKEIVL